MQDNELFELCKQVYRRFPEWNDTHDKYRKNGFIVTWGYMSLMRGETPLYTSDYLLGKLPKYLKYQNEDNRLELVPQGYIEKGLSNWCATYADNEHDIPFLGLGDTALKALLRLTLELHKQGLLEK